MIHAKNLCYQLDHHVIIDSVTLQLNAGELTILIGPNGAGKSTLLRLLTGYLTPTSGHCSLNGLSLSEWSAAKLAKVRAVMQQHNHLAFPFSVNEVISMGCAPHGKLNRQLIHQIMQQTDCYRLQDKDYRHLSGGEQQRVQLARALVQLSDERESFRWLFLDEPTSALDLHHQQRTLRLVKQLAQEQGLGICCILHDLNLAALYADRILLLHQGKLVEQGTPAQVLQTECLTHWYQAELIVTPHPQHGYLQIHLLP